MSDAHYDVVIVGGGAVGASVAYSLAAASDVDVALFEADELGSGSTIRSAGGVRQQFGDDGKTRLAMRSRELFDEYAAESGAFDLAETGYLYLARTEAEAEGFERDAASQRKLGLPVELVDPADCDVSVPGLRTDDLALGKYCPTDCFTDPGAVTRWLGTAAADRGAAVREGAPVTAIRTEGGRVTGVETGEGSYDCDAVVNAAGVWAAAVSSMVDVTLPITPARIQIVVTAGRHVPATAPFVVDVHERRYCRPAGDATLFGGSNVEEEGTPDPSAYDDGYDDAFVEQTTAFAAHRFGIDPDEVAIAEGWAGLKGLTPDGDPLVGEVDAVDGFYAAAGWNGHGFMLAPAIGEALASALVDGTWGHVDLDPYDPDRFEGDDTADADAGGFMGIS